jgi:hypothetical protein
VTPGDRVYVTTYQDTGVVQRTDSRLGVLVEFDRLTRPCHGGCGCHIPGRAWLTPTVLEPAQDTLWDTA